MYFIHYFYVTVTDAAPKCPGAESPASSWPCAELSRRRVGGAESAAPSCPIPLETCCRPWTWWYNDATALAGYATVSDDDDDELHYYWGLYNVWDPSANYWGPGPSRIDAHGLQLTRQGVYRDTVHTATH